MSNNALKVECFLPEEQTKLTLTFKKDLTWHCQKDSWLPIKKGNWLQKSTEGVVLRDEKNRDLGILKGLIFSVVEIPKGGKFFYDASGSAGTWNLSEVT